MTQTYFDPSRKDDIHILPNCEVYYVSQDEIDMESFSDAEPGWYWCACFPGCLPDSDPVGPFATEELATKNAQDI
jgi:hypothetical protein